jgi:hypothetical protein
MSERDIKQPIRVGVYETVAEADRAVTRLLAAGFHREEVTVICSDEHKEKFFRDVRTEDPAGAHTANAAVAGGVIGAAIGGLALAASALVTGGAAVLIAGPAIVGGSALAGTFTGAMMTRGFEKETADYYDQAVQSGKILVGVEVHGAGAGQRLALAERILAESGAQPVPLAEG